MRIGIGAIAHGSTSSASTMDYAVLRSQEVVSSWHPCPFTSPRLWRHEDRHRSDSTRAWTLARVLVLPVVPTPSHVFIKPVPNPARTLVTFHFQLPANEQMAEIVVRDVHGRQQYRTRVSGEQGQSLWDTRSVPSGTYTVELLSGSARLAHDRLIVQP